MATAHSSKRLPGETMWASALGPKGHLARLLRMPQRLAEAHVRLHKIDGAILSARSYLEIMENGPGFSRLLWDFVGGEPKVNTFKTTASVPASTPLSVKISKELAGRGFKFVGPTIVYAFMQAMGLVNDHLDGCAIRPHAERARRNLR